MLICVKSWVRVITGVLFERRIGINKIDLEKIFFHPDYTVGAGISPVQFGLPALYKNRRPGNTKSRAIPPVGNWNCRLTGTFRTQP